MTRTRIANLKTLRLSKDLAAREVAEPLGIQPQMIYLAETGKIGATLERACDLALIFAPHSLFVTHMGIDGGRYSFLLVPLERANGVATTTKEVTILGLLRQLHCEIQDLERAIEPADREALGMELDPDRETFWKIIKEALDVEPLTARLCAMARGVNPRRYAQLSGESVAASREEQREEALHA